MSYFFTKSQCGKASLCNLGISPDSNTFKFSSGVLPKGTNSAGRLGKRYICCVNSCVKTSNLSDASLLFSLRETFFNFKISALDFSPFFNNSPISLDNLLDSASVVSIST